MTTFKMSTVHNTNEKMSKWLKLLLLIEEIAKMLKKHKSFLKLESFECLVTYLFNESFFQHCVVIDFNDILEIVILPSSQRCMFA